MDEYIYYFYHSVMNLWGCLLTGNQSQRQEATYSYMKDFKIGDFVVETSSGFLAVQAWVSGDKQKAIDYVKCMFGTLEEVSLEEYILDEDLKKEYEDLNESIPKETAYYIKNLHGQRFRWTNASFLRVPTEYIDAL